MAKEEHRGGTGATKADDSDSAHDAASEHRGPDQQAPHDRAPDVREPTETTGEPIHHDRGGDPGDGGD